MRTSKVSAKSGLNWPPRPVCNQLPESEKPLYFKTFLWCRGRDLNPHVVTHGGF